MAPRKRAYNCLYRGPAAAASAASRSSMEEFMAQPKSRLLDL
jgi:hypothetical protein